MYALGGLGNFDSRQIQEINYDIEISYLDPRIGRIAGSGRVLGSDRKWQKVAGLLMSCPASNDHEIFRLETANQDQLVIACVTQVQLFDI